MFPSDNENIVQLAINNFLTSTEKACSSLISCPLPSPAHCTVALRAINILYKCPSYKCFDVKCQIFTFSHAIIKTRGAAIDYNRTIGNGFVTF